ncbi:MAG TPA: carbohydrate binding domain-containing protein [Tepidisphaeraceae bacterium]
MLFAEGVCAWKVRPNTQNKTNRRRSLGRAVAEPLEPRQLLAATFYLSPTGNDAASGKSPAAAWRTLDRANRQNFNSGDKLLLLAGGVFRAQGGQGANVMTNGDFELDLSSGWTDTLGTDAANSVVTNDPSLVHTGTGSLAIGKDTGGRGQNVTSLLNSNQTYELSFWTRRTQTSTGTCQVGITFYDANNKKMGTYYRGIRNTTWAQSKMAVIPPAGFARAQVFAVKSADESILYVDDVSLRSLPNGLILSSEDSGSTKSPLLISTYGKKPKPARISGGDGNALSIVNAGNIAVTNIATVGTWNGITGQGSSAGVGFEVVNTLPGNAKLSNITLNAVEAKSFRWGGIRVWGNNAKAGFNNVKITNSVARWNGDVGIIVSGPFDIASTAFSHSNITIAKNRVSNNTGIPDKGTNTGSGIQIVDTDGATVERNIVYSNGKYQENTDGGPVGIWTFDSNRINIQYNEAFDNHASDTSGKDGGGFDLDGGTTNSVIQYNYSHDNDGPGYLAVQFNGFRPAGNNIIRYNISQNDARKFDYGGLTLAGGESLTNVVMEHNTVFVSPTQGSSTSALRIIGAGQGVSIRNNIFIATGGAHLVNAIPGSSPAQINGNAYYTMGDPISIVWQNQFFDSVANWQAVGPETLNNVGTAFTVDPLLTAPGTGGMILSGNALATLTQYQLMPGSPLINAALDLPEPWTGYSTATVDYYGNPVPKSGTADVGAHELS